MTIFLSWPYLIVLLIEVGLIGFLFGISRGNAQKNHSKEYSLGYACGVVDAYLSILLSPDIPYEKWKCSLISSICQMWKKLFESRKVPKEEAEKTIEVWINNWQNLIYNQQKEGKLSPEEYKEALGRLEGLKEILLKLVKEIS